MEAGGLPTYDTSRVNWMRSDRFARVWRVCGAREMLTSGQVGTGGLSLPGLEGKDLGATGYLIREA